MKTLRPYQKEAIDSMTTYFSNKGKDFVLAASPSSGKTLIALEFIKKTPGKFLVFAHGQNVLKKMWDDTIAECLSAADQKRVTCGIPQSLSRKTQTGYDYIIIDEAHEFTFATMVQNILKVNKKAKVIYLTGTPSEFIYRNDEESGNYHIHIIPASDLIETGYVSDLYVGTLMTKVNIRDTDFNSDYNFKEESVHKLETDLAVQTAVDNMIDSLLTRLGARLTKKKATMFKIAEKMGMPTLSKIGKTMIACRSITQATKVNTLLIKKGYNSLLSNSENDLDSGNIIGDNGFINNPQVTFLVVVDRGILGFNMESLENVIDMTCSRNINRIYQLFARVMRVKEGIPNKFFFKMTEEAEDITTQFYLNASLALMFKDVIELYNGRNLDKISIPSRTVKAKPKSEVKATAVNRVKKYKPFFPPNTKLAQAIKIHAFLKPVYAKRGEACSETSFVMFGDIKGDLGGYTFKATLNSLKDVLKAITL